MGDSLVDTQTKLEEAQTKIDKLAERVPVPWKDTHVRIVGHKHLKGKLGQVVDVHFCRTSPSGLEIEVALALISPMNPRNRVRVDYHQVEELRFVIPRFLSSRPD